MKAQDLKLNNLVLVNGKIDIVNSISETGINLSTYEGCPGEGGSWEWLSEFKKDKIEGIPLSDYWFDVFNFKKEDWPDHIIKVHGWKTKYSLPMRREGEALNDELNISLPEYEFHNWGTKKPGMYCCTRSNTWIQYVHEMQNTYSTFMKKDLAEDMIEVWWRLKRDIASGKLLTQILE